jgi:hypothetical protein
MLLFSPAALAQEYDIRLIKEAKVGDQYRVDTTARRITKMTAFRGKAAVKNQGDELTTELVSSVKVLETNENERATKVALSIEKCVITTGGNTKLLIDTGRVVIGSRQGRGKFFTIDNVPVDPITNKALSMAVSFGDVGPTDDDIFGTREKRRVGDSWEINAALVAKSLKEIFNISTGEGDVKGGATLEGTVKSGRQEYLVISAWLSIDSFSVPLPDGVKIQDGQVKGSFSGKFPVDPVRERVGESSKIATWFTAVGPPDPKFEGLTIEGVMEQSVTREIEYLQ